MRFDEAAGACVGRRLHRLFGAESKLAVNHLAQHFQHSFLPVSGPVVKGNGNSVVLYTLPFKD
jgi:hypothetical protein